MAWTNLTYSFGSLLTSTKMTQLYDNFSAMATGATGAPTIQQSAISGEVYLKQAQNSLTTITFSIFSPTTYTVTHNLGYLPNVTLYPQSMDNLKIFSITNSQFTIGGIIPAVETIYVLF